MTSGSSVSVSRSEQALRTENLLPSTNVEIVNLTTKTRQAKIVIYRTRSIARGPAPARRMLVDEVKGLSCTGDYDCVFRFLIRLPDFSIRDVLCVLLLDRIARKAVRLFGRQQKSAQSRHACGVAYPDVQSVMLVDLDRAPEGSCSVDTGRSGPRPGRTLHRALH